MEVSEREDSVDMCLAIQKIKEESKLQGGYRNQACLPESQTGGYGEIQRSQR